MKIVRMFDFLIYWAIIIMPFSVVIAPGMANAFIGIFSASYILKKLIKREAPSLDSWVALSFLLLIAASLASFMNSVSYSSSLNGIIKLLKYFLIVLVCSEEIKERKQIAGIVIAVCCGVSLVSIDALWQFYLGRDFIHGIAVHYNIGLPRASASFPNPNILGVYLSALTPLVIGLAILYRNGKRTVFLLVPALLGLAGVYVTFSRGAGLALYVALLFLCIIGKKKWLTATLLALLIVFPLVMPPKVKQWAKGIKYNPVVFMFNEDRLSIYSNTINMIKRHPFVGVGVNTFSKNYGKYKTEQAERYAHTPDTIYAHNIYLHMGGEIGLLGLCAFLLFLFQVFRRALYAVRNVHDEYLRVTGLSLLACLIAFLVNGLTETSLYYPRVVMVLWYLLGTSLALEKFVHGQKE